MARDDGWSAEDDRLLAEHLSAEAAERDGARVWIAPGEDDTEGRVSDRGFRPILFGLLAVIAVGALVVPIVLGVLAALF